MSGPKNPKLHILIKPQFDAAHKATGLDIVLTIESLELLEDFTIVSFPSIIKPTTFNDGMKVSDEKGELPTAYTDLGNDAGPSCVARRQILGEVKLNTVWHHPLIRHH
jgi:hypothetical protein